MIFSKRITKNKNLLIEIEDLTGRTIVLVNRDNKELFARAQGLLLDDVVGFQVSGSSKMLFANDFIYPDASLEKEVFGDDDEYIAFSGDFHIGSMKFLEGNLMKFVNWLNGDVGDLRQKNIARKVKYLVLSGDNIDGVGVYPGQEKFLKIKGCRGQYEKLAEILGKIRKDIEIVMCPGQHDAVWVGEPQPAINKKWGGSLCKMENLRIVSNPSMVEIGGLKVLVYYGGSLNKFIDEIGELRIKYGHRVPTRVVEEILKRRHLAPVYGSMDIIPNKVVDDLVLKDLPDVFVVGGQHRAIVNSYNNILIISTSCWQSKTDFEEKVGNEPDPCKVPILNLKSREVKILDFSSKDDLGEPFDSVVELEDEDDCLNKVGGLKNG
jgi:DNA polymerase II small subunit